MCCRCCDLTMKFLLILIVFVFCKGEVFCQEENPYFEALKQNRFLRTAAYGYIEVRPGANLFYWFFYANGTRDGAEEKPLVIWVQGGPGLAASGVGNFAEFGPLHMDMKTRNHTWVKDKNVLLIDHPVGVGFSYATNTSLYVKTDREIAMDLSKAVKVFLRRHKEFRKTPTYIVGQSYGGKICPRLAHYLHTAIQKKRLKMNFRGIAIGGGWVSPKESSYSQPDYLYHTGTIDRKLYLSAVEMVKELGRLMDKKDYVKAGNLEYSLFLKLNEDYFINFNKLHAPDSYPALAKLSEDVNNYVKPTFLNVNQSLHWMYLSTRVYENLRGSLLVPSYLFVERLLNRTNLKIAVYNGNMDAITPLAGASNWVHKLNWPYKNEFADAKRDPIDGYNNGYYKVMKQLSFWSVYNAGHWVPEDNPEAMEHVFRHLMEDTE